MSPSQPAPSRDPRSVADPLIGRASERAAIGELLAAARAGGSRALVLRGPAGVGKSALLDDAVRRAGPMLVLHGVGIESEAELPFAALHQMLYPHLDRLDALPAPQAAALRGAFGLTDDDVPSRFLVGAATLTLLAALAESIPVLCVVDDVQWLDQGSADALLFAARRFQADAVAVLFAVRESSAPFPAPGLPSLRLEGLGTEEAQTLLDARCPGLPGPVRVEVLREAAGNPLALIELAAASRAAERDGRVDLAPQVGPLPVTRRVRDAFRAQIGSLPESTRTALVAAAADTVADLGEVLSVLAVLGLPDDALTPAEELDLVAVDGGRISFRHPLVRAAAYQGTPHALRIAVHRAYATVLAADADADRRTWHRAASSTGPDEAVAAELELAAERARRRGGAMAVSAAYERSARLSVDLPARARRTLRAARAAYDAGRADRAARLATDAADLATNHVLLAEATHVRAMVEYERTSPAADARLALEAARLMGDGAGGGAGGGPERGPTRHCSW